MYDFGPKAVQAIVKRGGLFQLNAFGFVFLMNFVLVSFYILRKKAFRFFFKPAPQKIFKTLCPIWLIFQLDL